MSLYFLFGKKDLEPIKYKHIPKVWRELEKSFRFIENVNNLQDEYYIKSQFGTNLKTKERFNKNLLVKEYNLLGDTRNTNIKLMKKRITTTKLLNIKASPQQLHNLGII